MPGGENIRDTCGINGMSALRLSGSGARLGGRRGGRGEVTQDVEYTLGMETNRRKRQNAADLKNGLLLMHPDAGLSGDAGASQHKSQCRSTDTHLNSRVHVSDIL